jgi:hypothetical protein
VSAALLLIQYTGQNMALLCCALFAGAATYISLVEHPAIAEGGARLTGAYLLMAHPRPVIFQFSFGAVGAFTGFLAGVASKSSWWVAGALLLAAAALLHLFLVQPTLRNMRDIDPQTEPQLLRDSFARLRKVHAAISIASLVSLSVFISNV